MQKFFSDVYSKDWGKVIFWLIFPLVAFFGSQAIVAVIIRAVVFLSVGGNNELVAQIMQNNTTTGFYIVVSFLVTSIIAYFVPQKLLSKKFTPNDLGAQKDLTWSDVALGALGLLITLLVAGVLLSLTNIRPGEQKIGFSGIHGPFQYIIAFLSLTIIPAIVEEFIFRGIAYGELRKINPWLAMFIVSLTFGIAHLELSLGVTTFVMSFVACFIREKITDTIWAGIILHFLKNALAFVVLFVLPTLTLM